jgi:hypothetical protein
MKIGERVLLPRVREAGRDTLIITDGFSCREQIMHGTRRKALHLAEVIQMGLRQPLNLDAKKFVETGFVQKEPSYPVLTAAMGTALIAAAGWLLAPSRRRTQSSDQSREQARELKASGR